MGETSDIPGLPQVEERRRRRKRRVKARTRRLTD